jgi:predicted secreted hydrolase
MAFQVRGREGRALYAGGTLRRPDGTQLAALIRRRALRAPTELALASNRRDLPRRSRFRDPLPEGTRRVRLTPLFDAQELDGRATGMPSYWEGLVSTPGGRGYLELTGYAGSLNP